MEINGADNEYDSEKCCCLKQDQSEREIGIESCFISKHVFAQAK